MKQTPQYLNIEFLKTKIKKLPRKVFLRFKKRKKRYTNKLFNLSKVLNELDYISKIYDADFGIIKSEDEGEYIVDYKIIRISYTKYLVDMLASFSHELAHRIQYSIISQKMDQITQFDNKNIIYLSDIVNFERIADRLAYFIYKKYFNHIYKLHHACFAAYKNKNSVKFLHQNWKGYTDFSDEELKNIVYINDLHIK